jgi:hypothetical protein
MGEGSGGNRRREAGGVMGATLEDVLMRLLVNPTSVRAN